MAIHHHEMIIVLIGPSGSGKTAVGRALADALARPFLDADEATLFHRVDHRRGHYMPASLVNSQLATLERSEDLIVVDAGMPIDQIVIAIGARLGMDSQRR